MAISVAGGEFQPMRQVLLNIKSAEAKGWSFERRPGGWWIATRTGENGLSERRRIRMQTQGDRCCVAFGPSPTEGGHAWYGRITKPTASGSGEAGQTGVDESHWQAQFPGKIRKVLVESGAVVVSGASLILMEAMKMEFALKAPCAGVVKKVLVTEGQQIQPGDKLLDFEVKIKKTSTK